MISCAAVQKLERYGQLGLRRDTVAEFINASLKDVKRANIYALTHLPTWEECARALHPPDVGSGVMYQEVVVTDALVYAMSFATAFVAYHVHMKCQGTRSEVEPAAVVFEGDALDHAYQLLLLLTEINADLVTGATHRTSGGSAYTQAQAHLLTNTIDLILFLVALDVQRSVCEAYDTTATAAPDAVVTPQAMLRPAMVLLAAVVRQLHRAAAAAPVEDIFRARTCPAALKQSLTKLSREGGPVRKGDVGDVLLDEQRLAELPPILRLLLDCTAFSAGGSPARRPFERFALFQRLSLLHAVVEVTPACAAHKEELQGLLCQLLASTACNRATRAVIYYRGDDVRLMQSNVRSANEYALHTCVTTAPIEASLVESITSVVDPDTRRSCALLMAQWIASVVFFFQSFCSDPSWTVFAQEQRRAALLRQAQSKHQRHEEHRRRRRRGDRDGSSQGSAASASSFLAASRAPSSRSSSAGGVDDEADGISDQRSVDSGETADTAASLASRASMLSTLSAASAASYSSFLSVLQPAEGHATADPEVHESADGNTNLPLILLEELALALHGFVDAFPAAQLDAFGLRAMSWQCIGQLLATVQASITPRDAEHGDATRPAANSSSSSSPPVIFNFGHDVRYNRGLGYESLGLLFAKIVAPRLEAGSVVVDRGGDAAADGAVIRAEQTAPQSRVTAADATTTQAWVEAALARCLAAYEVVAPHVVDANLPVIVRIAARTACGQLAAAARTAGGRGEPAEASSPHAVPSASQPTTLLSFLAGIAARLGRSNQIVLLLEALVAHHARTEQPQEPQGETDDVAALQLTFSQPVVSEALTKACAASLDPSSLVSYLVRDVQRWMSARPAAAGAGDEAETDDGRHDARDVLFWLQLLSTVLQGVLPTSVAASAVLEQVMELEQQLTKFFMEHLYEPYCVSEDTEDTAQHGWQPQGSSAAAAPSTCFMTPPRPKMLRRLLLQTLYALYRCREVTRACLQDLGLQHAEQHIAALERTRWRLQTHIGSLVGALRVVDLASLFSSTTRLPYCPAVQVRLLLPLMAVQRLRLAYSVAVVLGITAGPAAEARQMVLYVLQCLHGIRLEGGEDADVEAHAKATRRSAITAAEQSRVVRLANLITEDGWVSVVTFSKPRDVQATLVELLGMSYMHQRSPSAAPLWLMRCLRSVGGTVLRAVTERLVSLRTDDAALLVSSLARPEGAPPGATGDAALLPALLSALLYCYRFLGHVPCWPAVLQSSVSWLLALRQQTQEICVASRATCAALQTNLLKLIRCCLVCEPHSQDILSRALRSSSACHISGGHDAPSSLSALYVAALGVPVTTASSVVGAAAAADDDGGSRNEEDDDAPRHGVVLRLHALEDQLAAVVPMMFAKPFVDALLLPTTTTAEEGSADQPAVSAAMDVMAHLYSTALSAVQAARTSSISLAGTFLTAVASAFETEVATTRRMAPLLCFAQAMTGPYVVPATSSRPSPEGGRGDAGALQVVMRTWMHTLRQLLSALVECREGRIDPLLCRCLSTLFAGLHATHTKLVRAASKGKRARANEAQPSASLTFSAALAAPDDVAEHTAAAQAVALELQQLFYVSACTRAAADPLAAVTRSAQRLVDFITEGGSVGMVTTWLLLQLAEEFSSGAATDATGRPQQPSSDNVLSAVLEEYDPGEASASSASRRGLVERIARRALAAAAASEPVPQAGQPTVPRDPHRHNGNYLLRSARLSPCKSPAAYAYYESELAALPAVLRLLPSDAAPALLLRHVHAVLQVVIPTPSTFTAWIGGANPPFECRLRGYQLLAATVAAVQALLATRALRSTALKPHLTNLLSASVAPTLVQLRREADASVLPPLWGPLLKLSEALTAAAREDDRLIDVLWSFITSVVQSPAAEIPHSTTEELTEAEIMAVLHLWSHAWLPADILWRRPALLPNAISALFRGILRGMQHERYSRAAVQQLSAFFVRLVRHAEADGEAASSPAEASVRHGSITRPGASVPSRLLTLAAITASLFQVSNREVTAFTTYSNDLDFIAADLLRCISRQPLPPAAAAPIAYHAGTVIHDVRSSGLHLSDLTFTSAGDEEGRALLRQAALRLEDEEGERVAETRQIFSIAT